MADLISTPGGQIHKRNQMYRDDGDGSHSEARAAYIWIYDTALLSWRKATPADMGGAVTQGTSPWVISFVAPQHVIVDSGAIAATLAAETVKVIGTVNQGTSPWVTQDGRLPSALGQAVMSSSLPVVLASNQSSIPVAATLSAGSAAIGTVGTTSAAVSVGQQTSNTSAVQLSAGSNVPTNGIIVEALKANAAPVYIGGSGVLTTTGFELQAGQAVSFTCNLNTLYVIGANNTDKVCWNVV